MRGGHSGRFHYISEISRLYNYSGNYCLLQGTICQETGSYLLNFEGCKACGKKEPLQIIDKSTQEDEDEETITYKRK